MNEGKHVSYSAITTWQQCGWRYKLKYMDREQAPPSLARTNGSVVHKAIEVLNNIPHKATPDEIDRIVRSAWSAQDARGEMAPEDATKVPKLTAESVALVQRWYTSPRLTPTRTEVRFERPVKDILAQYGCPVPAVAAGLAFVGFVDGIVEYTPTASRIVEYKTSAARWTPERVQDESQVPFYHLLMETDVLTARYEILVKTKDPVVQQFDAVSMADDAKSAAGQLSIFLRGITHEIFPKVKGMQCSWCDFRDICIGSKEATGNGGTTDAGDDGN